MVLCNLYSLELYGVIRSVAQLSMEQDKEGIGLCGTWRSSDAFGNTSLDWSQAVKDKRAMMMITFRPDNSYTFNLRSIGAADEVITNQFRHVFPSNGTYAAQDNEITLNGGMPGIRWTYQMEEDDTLRIKLEGAKRFGRCRGVDVVYFERMDVPS